MAKRTKKQLLEVIDDLEQKLANEKGSAQHYERRARNAENRIGSKSHTQSLERRLAETTDRNATLERELTLQRAATLQALRQADPVYAHDTLIQLIRRSSV